MQIQVKLRFRSTRRESIVGIEEPRVTPGDHVDKLSPRMIKQLNVELGDLLKRFGYL
jgi:hypothetical protein